jgi:hypothetical protein
MNLLQSTLNYLKARALLEDAQDRHFMAEYLEERVVAEAALTVAEQVEQKALESLRAAAQVETTIVRARAA